MKVSKANGTGGNIIFVQTVWGMPNWSKIIGSTEYNIHLNIIANPKFHLASIIQNIKSAGISDLNARFSWSEDFLAPNSCQLLTYHLIDFYPQLRYPITAVSIKYYTIEWLCYDVFSDVNVELVRIYFRMYSVLTRKFIISFEMERHLYR